MQLDTELDGLDDEDEDEDAEVLSLFTLLVQKHLLYWYKKGPADGRTLLAAPLNSKVACSLTGTKVLALLVQKRGQLTGVLCKQCPSTPK